MKTTVKDLGEVVEFRISDFDPKYEPVFKMCYYHQDDNGYYKRYKADSRHIEHIKANFINNAQKMYDQLGYFTPVPWQEALHNFAETINKAGISWWLTGSCATCVRGIKLNPHDIDIMIASQDKDKVGDLFKQHMFEPILDTNGWVTKDFGVLFTTVRIDIATDPNPNVDNPKPVDFGPYAMANLEIVTWQGINIKVPPLHLQHYVNQLRGRHERAKLIEDFLNS